MISSAPNLQTVGILGAGRVGTAIARQALKADFEVQIATAKPAREISMIVEIITPGAEAVEAEDLAQTDLIVVAVPLHKVHTVKPELVAGKTVIDVMNYWPPTDGKIELFEKDHRTTSEVVQDLFPESNVVKTLNHIGYHDLEVDGRPAGAADRRALALAADSQKAKELVAAFLGRLGFDPVDTGPLSSSHVFEPGTEIFNGSHSARELRSLLRTAA